MTKTPGRDRGFPQAVSGSGESREVGVNRKLQEALETLVAGNTELAAEQLRDFVMEVEGLVERGALSGGEGRELSREADTLIRKFEATVPER